GSIVISMRHKGRTVADLAGDVVNARVRLLFLLVVLMGLWIVLAVFGLVIAAVFSIFPSSVLPVICQAPIAIGLGIWMKRGGSLLLGTVVAVGLMYASIAISANNEWAQITLPSAITDHLSAIGFWTLVLLAYVAVASVLPVQWLLQPRDYINSWQLLVAMGLLLVGLVVARPPIVAEAVNFAPEPAADGGWVPSFMPFLFVTIACGAISGFHCLVASGCSSRQLRSEGDAQYVGYGAMLTEGFLAVLVILACAAGIGMGEDVVRPWLVRNPDGSTRYETLLGVDAWNEHYQVWGGDKGLGDKLAPFIRGAANVVGSLGLSMSLATAIMGVFVASFAATTMDSACRLQRYIIAELFTGSRTITSGEVCRACGYDVSGLGDEDPCPECSGDQRNTVRRVRGFRGVLANRFVATGLAVVTALALALSDAPSAGLASAGKGGLILWPVFGATNQLLGGLALLVLTVWLVRSRRPVWVTALPMVFMLAMTGWAIAELIRHFAAEGDTPLLLVVGVVMLAMEVWIVVEATVFVARGRGTTIGPDPDA
ncbi:MAG: carbon starvation protein A, partial [Phycisphaerales bacterium JB059]